MTIIDSWSLGLGWQRALKMQETVRKEEIRRPIGIAGMNRCFQLRHWNHFLKGRLSKTSAIAGSILDIKPILEVNDSGALVALDKVRGRNKSLKRLIDIVGERGKDLSGQTIGIAHGDDAETMEAVKEVLKNTYGCNDFLENYVGCAIGAHIPA